MSQSVRQCVTAARVQLSVASAIYAHLLPVHDVPEGRDVLWSPVLVLEVVRVLPDVQAQDGDHLIVSHGLERVVLRVSERQGTYELPALCADAQRCKVSARWAARLRWARAPGLEWRRC